MKHPAEDAGRDPFEREMRRREEGPPPLDVRIDRPGREGLTGTAPTSVYAPLRDPESITIPPDGRPPAAQPAWRRDFPIDWPEDHYVARRDFVKFLVLTSLAFAVGQLWIAFQSWRRGRRGPPPRTRIAAAGAVLPGTVHSFRYPEGEDAVLVRTRDGRLVAYGQECTHLACAVIPQPETGRIHCPCHAGWFDLETGRPIAGPPRRPLDRIVLEEKDGAVWAVGVERRTT